MEIKLLLFPVEQFLKVVVVLTKTPIQRIVFMITDLMETMVTMHKLILTYNVLLSSIKLIRKGKYSCLGHVCCYSALLFFRINQDLRSWVQDQADKIQDTQSAIIPDPKSVIVSSSSAVEGNKGSVSEPLHHMTRKVARQAKYVLFILE